MTIELKTESEAAGKLCLRLNCHGKDSLLKIGIGLFQALIEGIIGIEEKHFSDFNILIFNHFKNTYISPDIHHDSGCSS